MRVALKPKLLRLTEPHHCLAMGGVPLSTFLGQSHLFKKTKSQSPTPRRDGFRSQSQNEQIVGGGGSGPQPLSNGMDGASAAAVGAAWRQRPTRLQERRLWTGDGI